MFHLHPESKFLGGKPFSRGTTQRRHVWATSVRLIGKEANEWERQAILGFDAGAQPEYGLADGDVAQIVRDVATVADGLGKVAAAKALKVTLARLNAILAKREIADPSEAQVLAAHVPSALECARSLCAERNATLLDHLQLVQDLGLRGAALQMGADPSNLRRRLRRLFPMAKIIVEHGDNSR